MYLDLFNRYDLRSSASLKDLFDLRDLASNTYLRDLSNFLASQLMLLTCDYYYFELVLYVLLSIR